MQKVFKFRLNVTKCQEYYVLLKISKSTTLHILACAFKMHFHVALWKDLHSLI